MILKEDDLINHFVKIRKKIKFNKIKISVLILLLFFSLVISCFLIYGAVLIYKYAIITNQFNDTNGLIIALYFVATIMLLIALLLPLWISYILLSKIRIYKKDKYQINNIEKIAKENNMISLLNLFKL